MANNEEIIVARAPGRITFCGGGSDVSPIPEKFGGLCLNASINKYATTKFRWRDDRVVEFYNFRTNEKIKLLVDDLKTLNKASFSKYNNFDIPLSVTRLFAEKIDRGFNLWWFSDVGLHSGLGTSAAVFASVIGVFNEVLKLDLTKEEVAETAFFLENEFLGHTSGRQDQYAAVFGGLNLFEFNGGGSVKVNRLTLSHDTLHELKDNLLLFFLFPRDAVLSRNVILSGEIEKDKIKNFTAVKRFEPVLKVKQMAMEANHVLLSGNLAGFADLLHTNWEEKKKHSQLVSNEKIDRFYSEIRQAGALAGKIVGAGGGGHMLVFCSPLNKIKVIKKAEELGAQNILFELTNNGLTVWHSNWHQEEASLTSFI